MESFCPIKILLPLFCFSFSNGLGLPDSLEDLSRGVKPRPRPRPRPQVPKPSRNATSEKIVNGLFGQSCQFPYQVGLFIASKVTLENGTTVTKNSLCGGSLIKQNLILTAAHCVYGKRAKNIQAIVGTKYLSDEKDEKYVFDVASVVAHEAYDPATLANDIAVVWLQDSVILDGCRIQTVKLATADDANLPANENTVVSGWGSLYENQSSPGPDQLQYVVVPIVLTPACATQNNISATIPQATYICAGFPYGGQDACQGDSGGPLIRASNGNLVGVVSWGIGCARPGKPGVYAKVFNYLSWINGQAFIG